MTRTDPPPAGDSVAALPRRAATASQAPSALSATGRAAGAAPPAAGLVSAAAPAIPPPGRSAVAERPAGTGLRAACLVLAVALAAPPAAAAAATPAAGRAAPGPAAVDVRPAPAPAAGQLAAWHRRYQPSAAPVRRAMKRLFAARRTADPTDYKRRYRQACAALAEALAPFDDPERRDALFPAAEADAAAHYHLRRAYAGLSRAAAAGAEGRYEAAELAFGDAARWFREATRVLERYGLAP